MSSKESMWPISKRRLQDIDVHDHDAIIINTIFSI